MKDSHQITLKNQTKATIFSTHVALVEQGTGTVKLDAEDLMSMLMAMKDPGVPEPPCVIIHLEGDNEN